MAIIKKQTQTTSTKGLSNEDLTKRLDEMEQAARDRAQQANSDAEQLNDDLARKRNFIKALQKALYPQGIAPEALTSSYLDWAVDHLTPQSNWEDLENGAGVTFTRHDEAEGGERHYHVTHDKIEFTDNDTTFDPEDAFEMALLASFDPDMRAPNEIKLEGTPEQQALLYLACQKHGLTVANPPEISNEIQQQWDAYISDNNAPQENNSADPGKQTPPHEEQQYSDSNKSSEEDNTEEKPTSEQEAEPEEPTAEPTPAEPDIESVAPEESSLDDTAAETDEPEIIEAEVQEQEPKTGEEAEAEQTASEPKNIETDVTISSDFGDTNDTENTEKLPSSTEKFFKRDRRHKLHYR